MGFTFVSGASRLYSTPSWNRGVSRVESVVRQRGRSSTVLTYRWLNCHFPCTPLARSGEPSPGQPVHGGSVERRRWRAFGSLAVGFGGSSFVVSSSALATVEGSKRPTPIPIIPSQRDTERLMRYFSETNAAMCARASGRIRQRTMRPSRSVVISPAPRSSLRWCVRVEGAQGIWHRIWPAVTPQSSPQHWPVSAS